MRSPDYRNLKGNAVKLLNALLMQFNGRNNGDLSAAWTLMKRQGFCSRGTLDRALEQLLDANLVMRTREGFFANPGGRCALYAVTWLPIDECPGKHLDVRATVRPHRKFSME
jgi:predicted transcriptional regulator